MITNLRNNFDSPYYISKNFLDEKECSILNKIYDMSKKTKGSTANGDADHRISSVFFINYTTNNFSWLFQKCNNLIDKVNNDYFRLDLTGYDSMQFTEYNGKDSHYDWHVDSSYGNLTLNNFGVRKLSLSILVSDEFSGGEFKIDELARDKTGALPLDKGDAVLFPSTIPHKVCPIQTGCRRSIVIWVSGPALK